MNIRDIKPLYGNTRIEALQLMQRRLALSHLPPAEKRAAQWRDRIMQLAEEMQGADIQSESE